MLAYSKKSRQAVGSSVILATSLLRLARVILAYWQLALVEESLLEPREGRLSRLLRPRGRSRSRRFLLPMMPLVYAARCASLFCFAAATTPGRAALGHRIMPSPLLDHKWSSRQPQHFPKINPLVQPGIAGGGGGGCIVLQCAFGLGEVGLRGVAACGDSREGRGMD